MVLTVRFIGSLRASSKKTELKLKVEKTISLKKVIAQIVEEQPKLKRALIDPELGDPRTNTIMLVNGRDISVLKGMETMLKDGDELVFVPVVHGG
jgi:molybdopterin synthase sulfur carrier subunit